MNLSAELVALVPSVVVTVISTGPILFAGEVAVICVAEINVKLSALLLLPNLTAVTPVKLVPVIVTLVPPFVDPVFGKIPVTVGSPW